MKKINKGASPTWFENWKKDFTTNHGRNATYKHDFPQNEINRLRNHLLKEQGYICCYCMSRINIDHSHLEHFWPKSIFQDIDMEYSNMLASCEGDYKREDHCGHRKGDWFDPDMVIPTKTEIEKMFSYSIDGKIHHTGTNKDARLQKDMIHNFGLDSFNLERNRKMAIQASEVYDDVDYTQAEIDAFIDYYNNKQDGEFIPYCKAIIDCLLAY